MSKGFVALVPVREGSERVINKNFRNFYYKKSLFDIKIAQLKKSKIFDKIYVSSDSLKVKKLCKKFNVNFIKRDSNMSKGHSNSWPVVLKHILENLPGDPHVVWALTTSPLFSRFKEAVNVFKLSRKNDSLVGVLAKKNFYLNKFGKGINFNPGPWHPYSQELETFYEVTGSVYIAKKNDMLNWSYWYGPKPLLFDIKNEEAIDVDTKRDFDLAKKIFLLKKK